MCLPTSFSFKVPIGSYCDQEETCEGGATCINSVCVCPAKTRNNGNNCTFLSNPSNIIPNTGQQQLTKELIGQGTFFKGLVFYLFVINLMKKFSWNFFNSRFSVNFH